MGSNMAEAHPVGFQWVMEAKEKGATVIHVDPRFTRTSALCDLHVPLRAGSDICFLGGVVNYIFEHDLVFRDYVAPYTNASFIVNEDFTDTEDLDGLFSGWDERRTGYDRSSWQYEHEGEGGTLAEPSTREHATGHSCGASGPRLEGGSGPIRRDPTLEHPRCVYQLLKRHFARYRPEMVAEVCGTPVEQFLKVCAAWTSASGRERTAAVVYAVGWTQHTSGAQLIRTAAIIQLLLGNIGRPGGGIMAMRGHASIQGSTDIPTLFNLLPGYLPMPTAETGSDLATYLAAVKADRQKGFWRLADAYMVSLLKEYFGERASAENDFGFDWLPRTSGDHGTYRSVMDMVDGKVSGYFLLGQNPAVGSAHGRLQRLGLANLDWLVVRDLTMIESATFFGDAPEIATGEIVPSRCKTEVFFFPAAAHTEKEGSFTQTQRMLQWRDKAVAPKGDQRSELWFFYHLGRKIKALVADSGDERDEPLRALWWDYAVVGDEPQAEDVLRRINGYDERSGRLLDGYVELKADGTTSCGCWIYSGVFAGGINQAARRTPGSAKDPYALAWGWVWPANRRILYNRAAADPEGRPWSQAKACVWWDEERGEWIGHDVPDFEKSKAPSYVAPPDAVGPDALSGDDPFIMQADGKGWLMAPNGLEDGPFPTHYEPHESPVTNALYAQQANPTRRVYPRPDNPSNPAPSEGHREVFPFVLTTARLTEHHTAGAMSRTLPYLSELQPALCVEVSPELARLRDLEHLGWAHVITSRAAIEARVVVTDRMAPLVVQREVVHQVWMPYHFGARGLVTGDAVNDLFGVALDPNVFIQETKAATCDIRPGRRPRGPQLSELLARYRARAGISSETGTARDATPPGGGRDGEQEA